MQFAKMHGLGNDFVVIDTTRSPLALTPARARFIADRHYGIGCDQILLVGPPRRAGAAFSYRIINADGSAAGQCGNGARCVMRFVREQGLTTADQVVVDVADGQIMLQALGDHQYRVALAVPQFEPARIPLARPAAPFYQLDGVAGQAVTLQALNVGNPHAVLRCADIDTAPVARLGPVLTTHAIFPDRANIGFMQIVTREHIRLRVFERGVGETRACGSGAAAAVVAGMVSGDLAAPVAVDLPGGRAYIDWQGAGAPVFVSGPAAYVFAGKLVSLP